MKSMIVSGLALASTLAFAQAPPTDATTPASATPAAGPSSTTDKDTKPSSSDDAARMTRTMGATLAPSSGSSAMPAGRVAPRQQAMDPFQLVPFQRGGN
jgi:hypothetical protein